METKSFSFLVTEEAVVRLEERRKDFAGVVFLGLQCSVWLVATLEVALRNSGVLDFVKSFQEGPKVLIIRGGGNRAGHFLELAVYPEGNQKGLILLPEGSEGRGWSRFAGELCKVMAFLKPRLFRRLLLLLLRWGRRFG